MPGANDPTISDALASASSSTSTLSGTPIIVTSVDKSKINGSAPLASASFGLYSDATIGSLLFTGDSASLTFTLQVGSTSTSDHNVVLTGNSVIGASGKLSLDIFSSGLTTDLDGSVNLGFTSVITTENEEGTQKGRKEGQCVFHTGMMVIEISHLYQLYMCTFVTGQ